MVLFIIKSHCCNQLEQEMLGKNNMNTTFVKKLRMSTRRF
ncbi:protein of unknown function [Xenorhabdus bovienii]|uniref:Uncharacterized protein n=1 Tax=Xenorhabdus bovienii TaxID=40576 RepID=A0A0B6XBE3_XENBV|nr:protein of unknown function [Xenorhabdus bovienii]